MCRVSKLLVLVRHRNPTKEHLQTWKKTALFHVDDCAKKRKKIEVNIGVSGAVPVRSHFFSRNSD